MICWLVWGTKDEWRFSKQVLDSGKIGVCKGKADYELDLLPDFLTIVDGLVAELETNNCMCSGPVSFRPHHFRVFSTCSQRIRSRFVRTWRDGRGNVRLARSIRQSSCLRPLVLEIHAHQSFSTVVCVLLVIQYDSFPSLSVIFPSRNIVPNHSLFRRIVKVLMLIQAHSVMRIVTLQQSGRIGLQGRNTGDDTGWLANLVAGRWCHGVGVWMAQGDGVVD